MKDYPDRLYSVLNSVLIDIVPYLIIMATFVSKVSFIASGILARIF